MVSSSNSFAPERVPSPTLKSDHDGLLQPDMVESKHCAESLDSFLAMAIAHWAG